jgi:hypothetical protein
MQRFLSAVICPKPEGSTFHRVECVNNTCPICSDLKLLPTCSCNKSEIPLPQLIIKWQRWQKSNCITKKGEIKDQKDLVKVQTDYEEFVQHFRAYWVKFIKHHDLANWQTAAVKYMKSRFSF